MAQSQTSLEFLCKSSEARVSRALAERSLTLADLHFSPYYLVVRILAIFALGMLVGLVAGYLAGKSSAGTDRNRSDPKNPYA